MASKNIGSSRGGFDKIKNEVIKSAKNAVNEMKSELANELSNITVDKILSDVDVELDVNTKVKMQQNVKSLIDEQIPSSFKKTVDTEISLKFGKNDSFVDLSELVTLDKTNLKKKISQLLSLAKQSNETATKQLYGAVKIADIQGVEYDKVAVKDYTDYVEDVYSDMVKDLNSTLSKIDLSSITKVSEEITTSVAKNTKKQVKEISDSVKQEFVSVKKNIKEYNKEIAKMERPAFHVGDLESNPNYKADSLGSSQSLDRIGSGSFWSTDLEDALNTLKTMTENGKKVKLYVTDLGNVMGDMVSLKSEDEYEEYIKFLGHFNEQVVSMAKMEKPAITSKELDSIYQEGKIFFDNYNITRDKLKSVLADAVNYYKKTSKDTTSDDLSAFLQQKYFNKKGVTTTSVAGIDNYGVGTVVFQKEDLSTIYSITKQNELDIDTIKGIIKQGLLNKAQNVNNTTEDMNYMIEKLQSSEFFDEKELVNLTSSITEVMKNAPVVSGFEELIKLAKESGVSLEEFMLKVRDGNIELTDSVKELLSVLGILSNNEYKFNPISEGTRHKDGIISDQYSVVGRKMDYMDKTDKLIPKLKELEQEGVQVGTIIGTITDETSGLFYEIQKTQKGKIISSDNLEFLEATDEQIQKFREDLEKLQKAGLYVDTGGQNILYDKEAGFSFIDLAIPKDINDVPDFLQNSFEGIIGAFEEYLPLVKKNGEILIDELKLEQLNRLRNGKISSNAPSNEEQQTKKETDAIFKKAESVNELYEQFRTLRNINKDIALYENPDNFVDTGLGKSFVAFDQKKTGSGYDDLKILKKDLLELSPVLDAVADTTERISKKDFIRMFGSHFGIESPFAAQKATDVKGIIDAYAELVNVNQKLADIKPDSHLAQTWQKYKEDIIGLNPMLQSVADHTEELVKPVQWQNEFGDYFKEEAEEAEEATGEVVRSLDTLEEKLQYLKDIKKESKFMETAEERKSDMEDKAWDVGGNNPRATEAETQKKMRAYEDLCEHIDKAEDKLDEFNMAYEKVIITLKNGQQIDILDALDLDELTLAKNQIKDIEFVLEGFDENSTSSPINDQLNETQEELRETAQVSDQTTTELAEGYEYVSENVNKLNNDIKEFIRLSEIASKGDRSIIDFKYSGDADKISHSVYLSDVRKNSTTKVSVKKQLEEYLNIKKELEEGVNRWGDPTTYTETSLDHQLDKLAAYVYSFHDAEEAAKIFGEKNKEVFKEVQEYIRQSEEASEAYKRQEWTSSRIRSSLSEYGLESMTYGQKDQLEKTIKDGGLQAFADKVKELFGIEIPLAIKKIGETIEEQDSVVQEQVANLEKEEQQLAEVREEQEKLNEVKKEETSTLPSSTSEKTAEQVDEEVKIYERLRDVLGEVIEKLQAKIPPVHEEYNAVNEEVPKEVAKFDELNQKINEIILSIYSKIAAIRTERAEVDQAVDAEIQALQKLINQPDINIKIHADTADLIKEIQDALNNGSFNIDLNPNINPANGNVPPNPQSPGKQPKGGSPKRPKGGLWDVVRQYQRKADGTYAISDTFKNDKVSIIQGLNGRVLKKNEKTSTAFSDQAKAQKKLYADQETMIKGVYKLKKQLYKLDSTENAEEIAELNSQIKDIQDAIKISKSELTKNGVSKTDVNKRYNEVNDKQKKEYQNWERQQKAAAKDDKKQQNAEATAKRQKEIYASELKNRSELLDIEHQLNMAQVEGTKQFKNMTDAERQSLENRKQELETEYQLIKAERSKKKNSNQDLRNSNDEALSVLKQQHQLELNIAKEKANNVAKAKEEVEAQKQAEEASKRYAESEQAIQDSKIQTEKEYEAIVKESYDKQKVAMEEIVALSKENLVLKNSQSSGDQDKVLSNNARIAELGKEIASSIELRNQLGRDSIKEHKDLIELQSKLNDEYQEAVSLQKKEEATDHNKEAAKAYKELSKDAREYYELSAKKNQGVELTKAETNRLIELKEKWDLATAAKEKYEKSLNGSNDSLTQYDKAREEFNNLGATANAQEREKLIKDLKHYTELANSADSKYMGEFAEKIKTLQSLLKDVNDNGFDFSTDESEAKLVKILQLKEEIESSKGLEKIKKASETTIEKLRLKISDFMQKNSAMGKDFASQFENLKFKLDTAQSVEEIRNITNEFIKLENRVTEADKLGKSFFKTIGEHWKSITAQMAARYFSIEDLLRYARTAVESIRQLDTALIDLKKTTTMTNSDLEEFYQNSSNIAKETGVTTQEIISQAAAWSRLGYSSKEAAESMAKLSSQFAKISPGTSVENATDYLVSTMKAFDIPVAEVESQIMDAVNRIGNTMATSNQEVGEMLKRSSAAMSAANNSLAETIALESAAVQITRNAETTGTAFRTISMRIRGYDEETEELSEDLQDISGVIADLTKTASKPTGISLFTDATRTTYKSTYDLLKEIAGIYHDLTDKQQAALLEKLAGKRGGQVLAGILNDFSEVERAISEIENSAGSADAEMSIIEESWDYKINALKETWVGIFQSLVDRGVIGEAIDFLTNISELLGNIASTPVLSGSIISLISGGVLTKLGKGSSFNIFDSFKNIPSLLKGFGNLFNGISIDSSRIEPLTQLFTTLSQENNFSVVNTELNKLTETEKALMLQSLKTGASVEQFNSNLISISSASRIANTAINIFKNTLNSIVIMGIGIAIGKIIEKISEAAHKFEILETNAKQSAVTINDAIKDFNVDKKSIDGIKNRYAVLAQEVNSLGTSFQSQGSLSTKEYEEFLDLSDQLADIFPTLTKGYDDNGRAILNLSGNVNTIVGSLDNLISREAQLTRSTIDKEMPTIWENNEAKLTDINTQLNQYENYITEYGKIRELYQKSLTSNEPIFEEDIDPVTLKQLELALQDIGVSYEDLIDTIYDEHGGRERDLNLSELTEEQRILFEDYIAQSIDDYTVLTEQVNSQLEQINAEMISNLNAYLSGDTAFLKLDETQKKLTSEILNNFDMSNLPEDVDSWDELTKWYHDNIIMAISKIDDQDVLKSINNIFSGDLTLGGLDNAYNKIIDYLTKPTTEGGLGLTEKDSGYELVLQFTTKLENLDENRDKLVEKLFEDAEGINGNMDATQWDALKKKYKDVFKDLNEDDIKALLNSSMNLSDIYNNADLVLERVHEYLSDKIPEQEPISLSDWLDDSSFEKDDHGNSKTRQDIINDYYSFLSNISELRDKITSGEEISEGDILGEYPDIKEYIDRYDDYSKAIDKYILDKYKELEEKNGDMSLVNGAAEFWTKVVDETNKALNNRTLTPIFDTQATVNDAVQEYENNTELWLNGLASSYDKVFDGNKFKYKAVDKDVIAGIKKDFKNLENSLHIDIPDEEMDEFVKVLTNSKTTSQQAQQAFDKYATSLFNAANGLKDINEENADYMKKLFKDNGLDADEAVDEYVKYQKELGEKSESLKNTLKEKQALETKQAGIQEALNHVYGEGREVLNQQLASIENEIALRQAEIEANQSAAMELTRLQAAEAGIDLSHINSTQDVQQILNIASACGLAINAMAQLESYQSGLKAEKFKNSTAYTQMYAYDPKAAEAQYQKYLDQDRDYAQNFVDNLWADIEMPEVSVGIDHTAAAKEAAGAGKDAAKSYTDAYNKELEALKWLKDQNYITEAEYLEKFRELYQRYYGDLSKYAKEYYEAEKEYYEQKIALQQKAINAAIRILDRQIKEQEKLRDAEKKEYEEQIKQIEKKIKKYEKLNKKIDKQIKLLQKEQKQIRKQNIEPLEDQIKSRQKVIDEINEEIELMERANDARQDEINLQKAQYELERARHQRTQLVYTEDTGDGQMRYRANPDAIRDAQENYDNAVYEHKVKLKRDEVQLIEDEVDDLNKQIQEYEDKISEIDKAIEKLEEEKEKNDEIIEQYQEQVEKYNEIIEKIDERYQKEIDRIEEYKQKWQELLEIQEQIEDLEVLSSLGINLDSLINLDPSVFENFEKQYTDTLSHLYDANQHYVDAFNDALDAGLDLNTEKMGGLEKAAQSLRDTLSDIDGSGSGGGSGGGGLSLKDTPKVLNDTTTEAEKAGETVNNQFENTDKKLLLLEKRTQDDFARSKLGFNDIKDITEQIDKVLGTSAEKMERAAKASKEIADNFKEASQQKLPSVSGNSVSGNSVSGNSVTGNTDYNGTVGNAFASGYPGLKHSEIALRSEYGQPELTVYPNGKYELTTEPTLSKLPKDTIIFNESQTKRILKNGKGNAYAEGTYRPLAEVMPDKAELFSKFEANLSNNMSTIQSSLDIISRNTAEINSNLASKITNNNVGMSYTNNGDINITCPGVTSQEVLDSIAEQLDKTFFGMATNSYQRAMKRS